MSTGTAGHRSEVRVVVSHQVGGVTRRVEIKTTEIVRSSAR